ncbi:hypothetical protein J2Z49_000271 [Desulfofundulus luciae]|uniref:Uncharacterized protein n=1 Tax=Desulfofundulus luciae TaxID=74702 RepID=A0ABU0AXG0_9FIRM|nr:hypothetical protein [Desulfofundulus luciae]MDQ0285178.1 hypothetical protein [Desulfofundulus luciae]
MSKCIYIYGNQVLAQRIKKSFFGGVVDEAIKMPRVEEFVFATYGKTKILGGKFNDTGRKTGTNV